MKKLVLAAVAAVGLASGASAATVDIDFVALAAGTPGDKGGVEGQTFNFGPLTITLTSSHNAYLDDLSGGKPGGLGVCQTLSGTQCNPSSDDNVTTGESVTLTFGGVDVLSVSNFVFNDADHNDISNSTDVLNVFGDDALGGFGGLTSFADVESNIASVLAPPLNFLTFAFADGENNASQFYLDSLTVEYKTSVIPLPASGLLLLGAMGGLGFGSWRRRKAA